MRMIRQRDLLKPDAAGSTHVKPFCIKPKLWKCVVTALAVCLHSTFICCDGKSGLSVDGDVSILDNSPGAVPQAAVNTTMVTSSTLETEVGQASSNGNKPEKSTDVPPIPAEGDTLHANSLKDSIFDPNATTSSALEEEENYINKEKTAMVDVDNNAEKSASSSHTGVADTYQNNLNRTEPNMWAWLFQPPEMSAEISEGQGCKFPLSDREDFCSKPDWSCRGRCGEESPTNGASQPGTCHCSHMCLMYESCCEDFERECPVQLEKAREELDKFDGQEALCSAEQSFKMILHCPHGYPNNMLRTKCEDSRPLSTFESSFPVTDSISGHHFRNKACWQCWQGRRIELGEPLAWSVSVDLETKYGESFRDSPQMYLTYIHENPEKATWHVPPGYTSYYCDLLSNVCSDCAFGADLEESCFHAPASFLQVGSELFKNRYCFFCGPLFGRLWQQAIDNNTSLDHIDCQVPNFSAQKYPVYNEFTVLISLRGTGLHLEVATVEENTITPPSWKSLKCDGALHRCVALSCTNSLPPQDGQCQGHLRTSTLWVQICFGAYSAAAASLQMCRIKRRVTSAHVTESIWPLADQCLKAGPVSRDFRVLGAHSVETSDIPEFYITFVSDSEARRGQGHTRLRNCILLAVSNWLYTRQYISFGSGDSTEKITHADAGRPRDGEGPENILGGNLNAGTHSTDDEKKAGTKETYICLQLVAEAVTGAIYLEMDEYECFLVMDFDKNLGRRVRGVDRAALAVVCWSTLVLLRAVQFIET
ncbi:hypothetical protein EGW08_011077 [Elysia chlorotica]|uniref:SMB domain-containing protein n=1 Tax=Elysia chlorotica TaxID=188477 RepID=A0A433THZ8_ELYCH|nr:hypothetical protein EGW08_011077 [Elysia chlorotica]